MKKNGVKRIVCVAILGTGVLATTFIGAATTSADRVINETEISSENIAAAQTVETIETESEKNGSDTEEASTAAETTEAAEEETAEAAETVCESESAEEESPAEEGTADVPETDYSYTELDDTTMYASTDVHVRSAPSKSGEILGVLSMGTSISVNGQCNETSWYRVEYKGETGYVCSKYLSKTKPESRSTDDDSSVTYISGGVTGSWSTGSKVGRMTIPSVGVDVALYYCSTTNAYNQTIVNATDSAAYMPFGAETLVADHVNQGFSRIKNCSVGTTLYITNSKGRYKYVCTKICQGSNTGSDLLDSSGKSASSQNSGGLCLYTCNGNWRSVTMVFFQPA